MASELEDAVATATRAVGALVRLVAGSAGSADRNLAAVEAVARLADAARVHAAAALLEPGAAEKLGFSSATAAVAALTGSTERTAGSRLAVADAVRVDRSISGAPRPPRRSAVDESLRGGRLSLDSAVAICRELDSIEPRLAPEQLAVAEAAMVRRASGISASGEVLAPASATVVAAEVKQIASAVDPDGARPREERARRRRSLRIGAPDPDGLHPVSGLLEPEVGGLLAGLLEAHRRSPRFQDLADATPSPDLDALGLDPRSPAQRQHDAFAEIVIAAASNAGAPRLDGAPVTVLVTVSAADLDAEGLDGDAIGTMSGSAAPVSRARLRRLIDGGGFRPVLLTESGAIRGIGSLQRCFTATQRWAIAARDGHRCATPGCTSPHYSLQVHHVIPDRDGGPTETSNGILLCYWHHRMVDDGPWEYRMVGGLPLVRGPGVLEWTRLRPDAALAA